MNLSLLTLLVFSDCRLTLKINDLLKNKQELSRNEGVRLRLSKTGLLSHHSGGVSRASSVVFYIWLTYARGTGVSTFLTHAANRLLQNRRQDGARLVYEDWDPGWEVAQKQSLFSCGSYSQFNGMCLSVMCKWSQLCIYTWNFHWFLLLQTTYAHTAMVSWNPSLESTRSHWVGMLSFVDNWKPLDTTQEVDNPRPPPSQNLALYLKSCSNISLCIQAETSWDSVTMAQV